jgi:hypothetical protein
MKVTSLEFIGKIYLAVNVTCEGILNVNVTYWYLYQTGTHMNVLRLVLIQNWYFQFWFFDNDIKLFRGELKGQDKDQTNPQN